MESFNGRLQDELPNRERFLSQPETRHVPDERRKEDDQRCPRGGPDLRTPAAFAESLAGPAVGASPLPAAQPTDQRTPILA